MTDTAEPVAAT